MAAASSTMRSPTGITNTIPRPKSPRRPDFRDHRGQFRTLNTQTAGTTASASTTPTSGRSQSAGRRRPHDEMGRFPAAENSVESSFDTSYDSFPARGGPSLQQSLLQCASQTQTLSQEYTREYAPVAKAGLGTCMDHTAVGLTDFSMTAAEAYRQECKSEERGEDSAFFVDSNSPYSRNDSTIQGQQSIMDTSGEDNSLMAGEHPGGGDSMSNGSRSRTRSASRDSRRRSRTPKGTRFPEASLFDQGAMPRSDPPTTLGDPPIMSGQLSPPPRLGRTSDGPQSFDPKIQGRSLTSDNLLEARMELFHLGQESVPQTEVRLARALQDLKRQDKVVDGFKRQLSMAQQNLDETVAQLEETKMVAQEKQFKSTEARARLVQDRKKMEDLYQEEASRNGNLREHVAKLQLELSTIKMSRRNAKNSDASIDASATRFDESAATTNSNQLIALKAEIVDLRSQLAEAHAVSIDDASTLHSVGEAEELRKQLRTMEATISTWQEEHDAKLATLQRAFREDKVKWEKKVVEIQYETSAQKEKLEANLKESVEEENQLRTELSKVKANLQRLERERSRKRLHSAADVDRLSKQNKSLKTELEEAKEALQQEQKESSKTQESLKAKVTELSEQVVSAYRKVHEQQSEISLQRSKLEQEGTDLRGNLKSLNDQVKAKSEIIAAQTERIAALEKELQEAKKNGPSKKGDAINSRKLSILERKIKVFEANERALKADLQLQKKLLEDQQAEHEVEKSEASTHQERAESATLEQLRRELEAMKAASTSKQQDRAIVDEEKKVDDISSDLETVLRNQIRHLELKVASLEQDKPSSPDKQSSQWMRMENQLKRDIAALQTKVQKSEFRFEEEKARAEEERRIAKENAAKHAKELQDAQQEAEKAFEEKLKLREELEELRRELLGSLSGSIGGSTLSEAEDSPREVPKNVRRLRNELAVARARLEAARDRPRPSDRTPQRERAAGRDSAGGTLVVEDSNDRQKSTPQTKISSMKIPISPGGNSESSFGSTWAPPTQSAGMKDVNIPGFNPSTGTKQSADKAHTDATREQTLTKAVNKTPSKYPESDKGPELPLLRTVSPVVEPPSSLSPKASGTSAPPSADSVSSSVSSSLPVTKAAANQHKQTKKIERSTNANVQELRRQLEESSKRLEKANSRLNGLVESSGVGSASSPYRGLNRQTILTLKSSTEGDGVMAEVTEDASGSFEVSRLRYADI